MEHLIQHLVDHLQLSHIVLAVVAAGGAMISFIGLTSVRKISLADEAARVSGVHQLGPLEKLQIRLDQTGLQVRVTDLIAVGLMIGMTVCLAFAVLGLVTLGLLCIPVGPLAHYWYLMRRRNRELRAFREALPDAIDDCADYLATDPALPNLIHRMSEIAPEPLRPTFEHVLAHATPGHSLQEALRVVALERNEVFYRQFLLVLADYGDTGNAFVRPALARVSHGQRALLTLQDRINASQAGARIVAYVYAVAPVAFLVFMRFFGGEVYPQFYATVLGQFTQAFVVMSGLVTYWLAMRVANRGIHFDEIDNFRTVPEPTQPAAKPKVGVQWP